MCLANCFAVFMHWFRIRCGYNEGMIVNNEFNVTYEASLYYFVWCCNKINKEEGEGEGREEVVAKIETTTDELKPNSGEKAKTETVEPSPTSEKEEPLFKSSLRVKIQPKIKVRECRRREILVFSVYLLDRFLYSLVFRALSLKWDLYDTILITIRFD